MNDLIRIIKQNGAYCLSGNSKTMMELLLFCVDEYENDCGVMFNKGLLFRYVNACMRNNVSGKGLDIIGYKQLIKFTKDWGRTNKIIHMG